MDKKNLQHIITESLTNNVENPLERLEYIMRETADRYIQKGDEDMLEHCDGMELASYMECFARQAAAILSDVRSIAKEHSRLFADDTAVKGNAKGR